MKGEKSKPVKTQDPSNKPTYKCDVCGRMISSKIGYNSHHAKCVQKNNEPKEEIKKVKKKPKKKDDPIATEQKIELPEDTPKEIKKTKKQAKKINKELESQTSQNPIEQEVVQQKTEN